MFRSFFLGGFECMAGYNRDGDWVDMVQATSHLKYVDADYRRLCEVGIHAVRDGIRWPVVDRGKGGFDFSSVEPMARAARRHGVDVVWDLCHFGLPRGLDPLSEGFAERFSDYCAACARYLRNRSDGPLWFTPMNEPSYFSWAAGQAGRFAPHVVGCHEEFKVAFVRAAICGIDAIRAEAPDARFLNTDPILNLAPCADDPASEEAARHVNECGVFESWDMLCGRARPELGGSPDHLDVIGINYFWNSQWEIGADDTWLADDDPRRLPLRELVLRVWRRFGTDIVISETAHWGENRAGWMRELADEVAFLLEAGVPLRGVCIYPIIGMFDWHAPGRWMPMGLWDLDPARRMRRVIDRPMLRALTSAQERVGQALDGAAARRA
ncbi:family 1 glycosylhydrolase [Massilia horti]|uniref:Glycosyl hydrolase family protein n=1 Tax=Massilia horti TaxID=2562153 RepID=A0A4Y9T4B4_9BURK|nr:family 1 glycosylhydrolase [Massilia horti]TFW35377.1 glycosyl hydrolase family protein [Massilia horti]